MVRLFSLVALLAAGVVSATAIEESVAGKHSILRTVKHAGKKAVHSHAASIKQHLSHSVDASMMRTVSEHKEKKVKQSVQKATKVEAKKHHATAAKVDAKKHHVHAHVEKAVTTAHIVQKSHQKVHGKSVTLKKHAGKHLNGKQDPAGDASAQPGSMKSVADQVAELGKAMCKGRENDPKCEMFKEKTEELEEVVEEVIEEKAEEKKAAAPQAEPGVEAEAGPAPPVEVPSQGFHGKKVQHMDQKTKVDNFAKEYPAEYPWSVYLTWGFGFLVIFILIAVVATMACKK